jgi:phosphate transport system substrate-binding protein
MHIIVILNFLLLVFSSQNAFSENNTNEFAFTLQGSNTIGAKLAPECARNFLSSKGFNNVYITNSKIPNEYVVSGYLDKNSLGTPLKIAIAAHGSSTGFIGLLKGEANIAMSSRPIKNDEIIALQQLGDMKADRAEHTIAIDGIAILVNPQNPVRSLTITQVAKIFSGEISNWKEVGGNDKIIHIYARDENSGTWDTFKELVFSGKYQLATSAQRFESSDELSSHVAADISAIGFTGLSSIKNSKVLAIADDNTQPMPPTEFTLGTEDYPLSRRLYFYTPYSTDITLVDEFVDFCLSEQGQDIVRETGFISQNIQMFHHLVTQQAPMEYQKLSKIGQRLSVNFRFDNGSPYLDNKAYRDIERLHNFMQETKQAHAQLHLVGFSDADNKSGSDTLLSRFRVLAVKGALLEEGLSVESIYAMGSFIQVAASDKTYSKSKNGRVEVWLVKPEKNNTNTDIQNK